MLARSTCEPTIRMSSEAAPRSVAGSRDPIRISSERWSSDHSGSPRASEAGLVTFVEPEPGMSPLAVVSFSGTSSKRRRGSRKTAAAGRATGRSRCGDHRLVASDLGLHLAWLHASDQLFHARIGQIERTVSAHVVLREPGETRGPVGSEPRPRSSAPLGRSSTTLAGDPRTPQARVFPPRLRCGLREDMRARGERRRRGSRSPVAASRPRRELGRRAWIEAMRRTAGGSARAATGKARSARR